MPRPFLKKISQFGRSRVDDGSLKVV
jgi:hypothetical protein